MSRLTLAELQRRLDMLEAENKVLRDLVIQVAQQPRTWTTPTLPYPYSPTYVGDVWPYGQITCSSSTTDHSLIAMNRAA